MDNLWAIFEGNSPLLQYVGKHAYQVYDDFDLIQMHFHLIAAALFPIFIGAHSSLRRPPSAAKETKDAAERADEDDDIDQEPTVEGLTPSDAILFPILAGVTLAGLYFIIKWLEDPAILNKILTWYFSILGVFGVGKLLADSFNVITTFVFPSVWSTRTEKYEFDSVAQKQVKLESKGLSHSNNVDRSNPFPGSLSRLPLPQTLRQTLWSLRALLRNHWIFRAHVHGIFSAKTKTTLNDVIGMMLGLAAVLVYNFNGKAWWLTNLMGFAFSYGTLQLLSPTTFWTGSIVLAGLFVYDIVMVFYTPLMVTVATSLEVPIKLVFPGPKRGSMLGLGDVVLPGIMMALALRFDLYLYYLRQNKSSSAIAGQKSKAPIYVPSTGVWGERFWTSSAPDAPKTIADGGRFPKVYFTASVIGYCVGMVATLAVLRVFNHAQPALLYLVPGVLIALWGTAAARGEIALMWVYTEDGSIDVETTDADEKKEKTSEGKDAGKTNGIEGKKASTDEAEKEIASKKIKAKEKEGEHTHHVFLFSLSEPKSRKASS
jgi:minor histocompatibility antigen H13